MTRETTKWPSTRWPITKIMSSDGCKGDTVPLEMGPWYDFHEVGCHLGNVGLRMPGEGNRKSASKLNSVTAYLIPTDRHGVAVSPILELSMLSPNLIYGQAKSFFGNALSVSSSRNLSRSMMVEPERKSDGYSPTPMGLHNCSMTARSDLPGSKNVIDALPCCFLFESLLMIKFTC